MNRALQSASILAFLAHFAHAQGTAPDEQALRARIVATLEKRIDIAVQAETRLTLERENKLLMQEGGRVEQVEVLRTSVALLEAKQRTFEVRLELARTKARFEKTGSDATLKLLALQLRDAEEAHGLLERIKGSWDDEFKAGRRSLRELSAVAMEVSAAQDRVLRIQQAMDELLLAKAEPRERK